MVRGAEAAFQDLRIYRSALPVSLSLPAHFSLSRSCEISCVLGKHKLGAAAK